MENRTQKVKKKLREIVTVERVAIVVGTVVAYTYVMSKFDYRMVKPVYSTDTHVVFNRAFYGTTAVKIQEEQ